MIRRPNWLHSILWVLFWCWHVLASEQGQVGLLVKGEYTVKLFNPSTGKLHEDSIDTNVFWVWRCEEKYKLCVTNTQLGYVQYAWAIYDRTKHIWVQCRPNDKKYPVRAEIYPKPFVNTSWWVPFSLEYPWLMYCLSPKVLMQNQRGTECGRYYGNRISPARCGWRLEGTTLPGGVFFELLRRVRDVSLDLDYLGELRREELDCPETIDEWNLFHDGLSYRRTIPNGFVSMEYRCGKWLHTNGVAVPVEGLFRVWFYPRAPHVTYKSHSQEVEIRATSVELISGEEAFLGSGLVVPSKGFETYVRDYRYRRFENDRKFNCAHYTLKPGEPIRSANDPDLLAQAERYLKRGRKYYEPPVSGRHKVLWAVAVVLAIPPVLYLLYQWHDRRRVARQ